MSDYLQRLLSRHFGPGASVLPNANRYFSRGAEVAAETSPAGLTEPAPASVADALAEERSGEGVSYPALPQRPARPVRDDEAAPLQTQQSPAQDEARVAQRPAQPAAWPPAAAARTTSAAARTAAPAAALHGPPARPAASVPLTQAMSSSPETREPPAMRRAALAPRANDASPKPPATPTTRAAREAAGKPSTSGAGSDALLPSAKPSAPRVEGAAASAETVAVHSVEAAARPTGPLASRAPASGRQAARSDLAAPRSAAATPDAAAAGSTTHSVESLHDARAYDVPEYVAAPPAATPGDSLATRRERADALPPDPYGGVSDTPIRPFAPLPAASPAAAPAAPEITVTIGTVELHAAAVAAPPAAAIPPPRGPRLSLDEYLQRRGRGRS